MPCLLPPLPYSHRPPEIHLESLTVVPDSMAQQRASLTTESPTSLEQGSSTGRYLLLSLSKIDAVQPIAGQTLVLSSHSFASITKTSTLALFSPPLPIHRLWKAIPSQAKEGKDHSSPSPKGSQARDAEPDIRSWTGTRWMTRRFSQ